MKNSLLFRSMFLCVAMSGTVAFGMELEPKTETRMTVFNVQWNKQLGAFSLFSEQDNRALSHSTVDQQRAQIEEMMKKPEIQKAFTFMEKTYWSRGGTYAYLNKSTGRLEGIHSAPSTLDDVLKEEYKEKIYALEIIARGPYTNDHFRKWDTMPDWKKCIFSGSFLMVLAYALYIKFK